MSVSILETYVKYIDTIAEEISEGVSKVILFGSYARKEQKSSSDLDVAMVFDKSLEGRKISIFCGLLREFDLIEVDVYKTTDKDLEEAESLLDPNFHIKQEGILLWERPTKTSLFEEE